MKFLLYITIFSSVLLYFAYHRGWIEITPAGKQTFRNLLNSLTEWSEKIVDSLLQIVDAIKNRFSKK